MSAYARFAIHAVRRTGPCGQFPVETTQTSSRGRPPAAAARTDRTRRLAAMWPHGSELCSTRLVAGFSRLQARKIARQCRCVHSHKRPSSRATRRIPVRCLRAHHVAVRLRLRRGMLRRRHQHDERSWGRLRVLVNNPGYAFQPLRTKNPSSRAGATSAARRLRPTSSRAGATSVARRIRPTSSRAGATSVARRLRVEGSLRLPIAQPRYCTRAPHSRVLPIPRNTESG